ncbi:MAG: ATP-binding protein [Candidatus Desantisbacteria bacterium]
MTIGKKLGFSFNLLCLVIGVIGFLAISETRKMQRVTASLDEILEVRANVRLSALKHLEWIKALDSYIILGEGFEGELEGEKCEFAKWYDGLSPEITSLLGKSLKKIDKPHRKLHSLAKEIIRLREQSKDQEANEVYAMITKLSSEIETKSEDIRQNILNPRIEALKRDLVIITIRQKLFIVGGFFLVITIAIIVWYLLNKSIGLPLKKISVFTSEIIQKEDFTRRLEIDSHDEIAVLSENLNLLLEEVEQRKKELENVSMEMALGLSESFEVLRRIGQGDPGARISCLSKNKLVKKLMEVVNQTGDDIQKIIEDTQELALGLSEAFEVLKRVAKADFSVKMAENSENEFVAKLSEVVNQTVAGILEFNLDLEKKVTERTEEVKAKSIELERTVCELREVNKELDDFVYTASHDLKEPLRGLETFSKFILEDYKDNLDNQGKDYLKRISAGANRMRNLIDDLLSLSRITRTKRPYVSINTTEIAREAAKRLEPIIMERNCKLQIREDMPIIYGDKVKLVEVFYNLILNAIKYNDKEKPSIKIDCPVPQPSDAVIVWVKDNGIGIDVKYFEEIFKIFKRLHTQEEYGGGTGAGLAIVKRIIDEHNGKIWVESELTKGSKFYISLPRAVSREEVGSGQEREDTLL